MSLSELVKAASLPVEEAPKASSLNIGELREKVKQIAKVDELATLVEANPQRAKNEIEHACDFVLKASDVELAETEKNELKGKMLDSVFGLGPIEQFINDENVTEVMINGFDEIFIERDGRLEKTDAAFENEEQLRVLIDRIVAPLGRRIDESCPVVNARLASGHRVNAVIPPVTRRGAHVTIRAFSRHVFTLQEMCEIGSIEHEVKAFLEKLIRERKNVVVSGGTGSGKTTMLNALSCVIGEGERIITIEDAAELQFAPGLHVVSMEARPENAEGCGEITIRDLVKNSLRMRPDRIIVGECRGEEALDMLQAMNTGHDGSLTTIHANSTKDVVERMVTLVRFAVDLPLEAILAQIGTAFDFILQVSRARSGKRFLSQIAKVEFMRETSRVLIKPVYSRFNFESAGVWEGMDD